MYMLRILDEKVSAIDTSTKVCRNIISSYVYVICQMASKIIQFFNIVKFIVTNAGIDMAVHLLSCVLYVLCMM